MIVFSLNGQVLNAGSAQACDLSLSAANAQPEFELWASIPDGPQLSMLRNGPHAWLMYLGEPGDSGFRSVGAEKSGTESYTLSNGQVDEYPLSWCIDLPQCFEAFRFFHARRGARPEWIAWTSS